MGKKKDCAYIGIESRSYELPEETKEEELLALLDQLNHTEDVHGILVQLPLPSHMDESKVVKAIDPAKDVMDFIRSISGSFVSEGMALTAVRQLESFNF